jgi:site-specific recombinase XerD
LLFRHKEKDYVLGARTNIKVSKKYWIDVHKVNIRDIDKRNEKERINKELNELENFILENFYRVHNKESLEQYWLKEIVKEYYTKDVINSEVPERLTYFIDYYIENRKSEIKKASITKYKVIKHKMERFEEYLGKPIIFSNINENFKTAFKNYYFKEHYSQNTAQRELNIIKTFCKYAKRNGVAVHPEADFLKLPKVEVPKIYLSLEELERIKLVQLPHDYLENARDWLIISCNLGQRISDFMRFRKNMIRVEKDTHLLEFKQKKTGKLMTNPLLPEVMKVLNKHNGNFPRRISDQRYNEYIKEVCKYAKIENKIFGKKQININEEGKPKKIRNVEGYYKKYELVTSHIGRRSFATNYYGKIPTSFLKYITGHSTEAMFLNYIGKSNKDIALELSKYFKNEL